ncbi:MAG: hypothetical protein AAFU78_17000, partial [Cyanobacteria bacterium J06633_2]
SVINAHVQAQTISGQIAIGNHILQIGHMSGGVVNFASNEPRKPQAIDTDLSDTQAIPELAGSNRHHTSHQWRISGMAID